MTDLHFNASPFHQAAKRVFIDSGRQPFGQTQQYLERTVGGLDGGSDEMLRMAKMRGRISLLHLVLSLWKTAETKGRANEHSYFWKYCAKAVMMNICWSDLLVTLSPKLQDTWAQLVHEWIEGEEPKYNDALDTMKIGLQGNYWCTPLRETSTQALINEMLWNGVSGKIPAADFRQLLQDSLETTQLLYQTALELGARDPLRENLRLLASAQGISDEELEAAHELLSFTALIPVLRAKGALSQLMNQTHVNEWPDFLGEWGNTAGFPMGSLSNALAPDSWLDRLGLITPFINPCDWLEQYQGPLLEKNIRALLKPHRHVDALILALLDGSYAPFQGEALPMDNFSYMGADQRNLIAFSKAQAPQRLLLVGDSGTGKTSIALCLAAAMNTQAISAALPGQTQQELTQGLRLLQRQSAILDKPVIMVDPLDGLLWGDKNFIEQHLMDGQVRRAMTTSEIWTMRNLKDIPQNILAGFDLIVHLRSMPLAEREKLAEQHFEPAIAKRVAQMSATPGDIMGAVRWSQTTQSQDWSLLSMRLNGIQEAIMKTKEANEALPLQCYTPNTLQNGFETVAGQDDAVARARRLIGCLQDPQKFKRIGAKTPKGVLLTGGPGMGKTHLARAMAVEAGVPFLLADCAAMARNAHLIGAVFAEARRFAPCILFLDELDAIGTAAKGAFGGSPDPARQGILNRLLMELDGVEALDGVLVIGATHRGELLDSALVRSGRLGWHIPLALPDTRSRRALWLHYAQPGTCADTIAWDRVARISSGMTPADIAQAFNVAAIETVEQGLDKIGTKQLVQAIDETLWHSGVVETHLLEDERWRTAVHEAGHALMAWHSGQEIERASIQPRSGSLGHVRTLDEEGRVSRSPTDLICSIAMLFGGLAAEEVVFGKHSTGASSDLDKARMLARMAVRSEGMNAQFPGGVQQMSSPSEHLLYEVEQAENDMLREIRANTITWLGQHRAELETFAKQLQDQREMDGEEIEAALGKLLSSERGSRSATAALAARGFSA